ncbi:MAG: putative rRNA maturation factor [Candidatus Berkelbacteria bacterium]|nr:putative rRNA maturation factor [Candidatus Berkelbacteria bacterium]
MIILKNIDKKYHFKIKKTVSNFLGDNNINSQSSVSVEFVSSKKIKALNKKCRKLDKPTDVLSFPIWKNIQDIPRGSFSRYSPLIFVKISIIW